MKVYIASSFSLIPKIEEVKKVEVRYIHGTKPKTDEPLFIRIQRSC